MKSLRTLIVLSLAVVLASPALARGREGRERQSHALAALPAGVSVQLDALGVPEELRGTLSARESLDPADAAAAALDRFGDAFGRGVDDGFVLRLAESDTLGQAHVRMTQTYRGVPVLGGELIVHLDAKSVIGINGRFLADVDVDTNAAVTEAQAASYALTAVEREGGANATVVAIGEPVVFGLAGEPRLTLPVTVFYSAGDEPHMDEVHIDAVSGRTVGSLPKLYTAKNRKIYNLDQKCITTGSELPGTLLFQEGGSSADTAGMGAYNGTGKTYDYYVAIHNRDSYDNAGGTLQSSVHASFSTGFFGCSKANAAWLDSPYNQMAYGDGDGSQLGNLAMSMDVTSHELTHGVCSRTANLVYANESGALNEANSDMLGRAAAFWTGDGSASVKTDWAIGADVYTPSTPGDALRYMYDPAKDSQSADYWPTRNYATGCTPSNSNDQCGVHTNSGIANLFFYLVSQGGTHPRGKTTVSVPAIGLAAAEKIWYRALVTYMTSSTNFQGARTASANAAADLYGGSCSATWQAVQKAWDAVGVPGTWTCSGPTTYTVSGNAGTSGATVTAGSFSATSDAGSNYTIAGLAAGTYTVTPSKSGCTFSPVNRSVTITSANVTGVGFTAICSGPTTYSISGSAGTPGATVRAGTSSATSDAGSNYTIAGLAAGTYTVTASKTGCTFSPASLSVTVGPNATGKSFTATCGGTAQQLLQNPGFESGAASWTASAGVIENSPSPAPRTGTWKAFLQGYGFGWSDNLSQSVTIPASATSATLSFWLRVATTETTTTTAYDTLKVQIRNASNQVLATLATYSNLNKTTGYVQKSLNVLAWKGQTVKVYFLGKEDWSKATSFLVDDTALKVQ